MGTAAISGIGTVFARLNGSIYETVGEVTKITGPSQTRETIDATSFDSVGGFREFISSLRDGGTLSFDANYTLNGYGKMLLDFNSDVVGSYKITLPDTGATQLTFQGLVTEVPLDIPLDDKISMNVSIKITGAVTLTS